MDDFDIRLRTGVNQEYNTVLQQLSNAKLAVGDTLDQLKQLLCSYNNNLNINRPGAASSAAIQAAARKIVMLSENEGEGLIRAPAALEQQLRQVRFCIPSMAF